MDKIRPSISIHCPEHQSQFIGILDIDSSARKLCYCYGCIAESHIQNTFPKTIRTFPDYLKETSEFYKKCRQRVTNAGEPPAEYIDELGKKAERLEKLSKHIDKEKQKAKEGFEEIRKNVLKIIDIKERECLQLLESEISGLSEIYMQYEKLLNTGWLKLADIEAMYPTADVLEQRVSRIVNIEQLETFVKEVKEDVKIEKLYCDDKDGLDKRKYQIMGLINSFKKMETSWPQLQSPLLKSEDLEGLMKELMKDFTQQDVRVENSIALRLQESPCGSHIIKGDQYEQLRQWLYGTKNFSLKLLYRGSEDGLSSQIFHNKCNNKGPTLTLLKCRFNGAVYSSVLGGFIDHNWHSNSAYTNSNTAFLFSLNSGVPPVMCPIMEYGYAIYGHGDHGPRFGAGPDLYVESSFKTGSLNSRSYSGSAALKENNESKFVIEEIEVFQVMVMQ